MRSATYSKALSKRSRNRRTYLPEHIALLRGSRPRLSLSKLFKEILSLTYLSPFKRQSQRTRKLDEKLRSLLSEQGRRRPAYTIRACLGIDGSWMAKVRNLGQLVPLSGRHYIGWQKRSETTPYSFLGCLLIVFIPSRRADQLVATLHQKNQSANSGRYPAHGRIRCHLPSIEAVSAQSRSQKHKASLRQTPEAVCRP